MKYVWLLLATSVLVNVIAILAFISSPSSGIPRGYFISEDSLVENLTAGLFFCTFLFALVLLKTRSMKNKFNRKWLILLLALGLIGFLDEISFGERLLDLEMPRLGATKIDAVHDFFELGLNLTINLITHHQLLVLLLLLSGLILSIIMILKFGKRFWESAIADSNYPLFIVMFIFIVLIFSALILDARLLPFSGYQAVEELFELDAALALLASCFIIYKLETNEPPL